MKPFHLFKHIYLYRDAADMRKQINGLAILVEQQMNLDLFSEAVFVFTNRRRNMVKVLYWDKTGFALWLKKLDKALFKWPRKDPKSNILLNFQQLSWLLDGYDLSKMKPHEELKYKSVL